MNPLPASSSDPVRILRILAIGFLVAALVLLVVLLALSGGWDDADDGFARTGIWVAGITGLVGLVVAVTWRNRVVAAPVDPNRLLTTWIMAVAFAEVGMLVGFVFAVLSRTLTPFVLGAAILGLSLVVLTTALSHVELDA